jgi:hypothetical protein
MVTATGQLSVSCSTLEELDGVKAAVADNPQLTLSAEDRVALRLTLDVQIVSGA